MSEVSARREAGTLAGRVPWATLAGLGLVVSAANVLFWLAGAAPISVWASLASGTVGSGYALGQTLAKATPLVCTGASVALALRAGLVNIGAEGQLAIGVLAAAFVGAHMPAGPPSIFVPVAALAAAGAGAALGGLAGFLRGRFGAHEVITTLMLNGLVAVSTTYLYGGPLRVGVQVHTAPLPTSARVPRGEFLLESLRGSSVNAALLLALVLPFLVDRWLLRTGAGARVRALGSNVEAARALGVSVTRTSTLAMALAGALGGLGGIHYVCGAKGYAEEGLGSGVGFAGLAVAVLARGRPMGLLVAAVLLGALGQGGLAVNALVPADVLLVVQAALLLLVGAEALRQRDANARERLAASEGT